MWGNIKTPNGWIVIAEYNRGRDEIKSSSLDFHENRVIAKLVGSISVYFKLIFEYLNTNFGMLQVSDGGITLRNVSE